MFMDTEGIAANAQSDPVAAFDLVDLVQVLSAAGYTSEACELSTLAKTDPEAARTLCSDLGPDELFCLLDARVEAEMRAEVEGSGTCSGKCDLATLLVAAASRTPREA